MADDFGIAPTDEQQQLLRRQQIAQMPPSQYPREADTGLQRRGATLASNAQMQAPGPQGTAAGAPPASAPTPTSAGSAPSMTMPPPGPLRQTATQWESTHPYPVAQPLHGVKAALNDIGQIVAPETTDAIRFRQQNAWESTDKALEGAAKSEDEATMAPLERQGKQLANDLAAQGGKWTAHPDQGIETNERGEVRPLEGVHPELAGEPTSNDNGATWYQSDKQGTARQVFPYGKQEQAPNPTAPQGQQGNVPQQSQGSLPTPSAPPRTIKLGAAPPTPDQQPVPPDQVKSFAANVKAGFPSLTPGQVQALTAELGPNPTQADMAKAQANAEAYSKANEASSETKSRDASTQADRERTAVDRERLENDKLTEKANTVGWGYDPAKGEKVLTNQAEAEKNGYQYFQKTTPADVEKDENALRQMTDVQLNVSRYREALKNQRENIPPQAVRAMNLILSDANVNSVITNTLGIAPLMDAARMANKGAAWNSLTDTERDILTGYLRSKASVLAYQKALTGVGRTNKEQMVIEMENLPEPFVGSNVAEPRLQAFQENIDQASKGFGRIPWLDNPSDARARIEKPQAASAQSPTPAAGGTAPQRIQYDAQGNRIATQPKP